MIKKDEALFVGRPSRTLILVEAISMLALFVVLFITLFFLEQFLHIDKNLSIMSISISIMSIINYVLYALLGLVALYRILKVTIKVYSVKYTLTEEVLEVKVGLFSIRTDILQLYRVKDIIDFQPFFYRFYNIGDITLISTDLTNPNTTLIAIDDFRTLKNKIRELVENKKGNAVLETL